MHAAIDVSLGVVHGFMNVLPLEIIVGHGIIGVDRRSEFYVVKNLRLQCVALHIRNNGSADLALIAIQHPHDDSLASCSASVSRLRSEAFSAISVHVLELSTHKGFVNLYPTAFSTA